MKKSTMVVVIICTLIISVTIGVVAVVLSRKDTADEKFQQETEQEVSTEPVVEMPVVTDPVVEDPGLPGEESVEESGTDEVPEETHADDDVKYTDTEANVELADLTIIQQVGDDAAILNLLKVAYAGYTEPVQVTLWDWDDDYYYMRDLINGKDWVVDRATLSQLDVWQR